MNEIIEPLAQVLRSAFVEWIIDEGRPPYRVPYTIDGDLWRCTLVEDPEEAVAFIDQAILGNVKYWRDEAVIRSLSACLKEVLIWKCVRDCKPPYRIPNLTDDGVSTTLDRQEAVNLIVKAIGRFVNPCCPTS